MQNCYCEPSRDGYFVRQPYTALSNMGYLIAGGLVLCDVTSRNATRRETLLSPRGYGLVLLVVGVFSFFSHASLTRVGEWFDLMGVYLIQGTLLALSLGRLGEDQPRQLAALLAVILVAGGVQMGFAPQAQMLMVGALLVGITVAEVATRVSRKAHGQNRYLLAGVGFYLVGVMVWGITSRQGGCLGGFFPGHTIWHVLSAAALGVVFRYYFPR